MVCASGYWITPSAGACIMIEIGRYVGKFEEEGTVVVFNLCDGGFAENTGCRCRCGNDAEACQVRDAVQIIPDTFLVAKNMSRPHWQGHSEPTCK